MSCVLPFASGEHSLLSGTVLHREEGHLLVQCPSGVLRASLAASCLLQPERNDTVLLVLPENGAAWVLAVLVRHGETATLDLPARSTLHAEDMTLAGSRINCTAETLELGAAHMAVRAGVLSLSGGMLLRQFKRVCTVAHHIWEYCRRTQSTCAERREHTQGLAQSTAGRMRVTTETNLRVRAESADIRAQEHLLLDAEHIKVG